MKREEDFTISMRSPTQLLHIDEPLGFRDVLSMLGTNEDLTVTPVNHLPEYGGPDVVADNNVPSSWCNTLDEKISCADLFYRHGTFGLAILNFLEWWT